MPLYSNIQKGKKKKLRDLSLRVNYTDRPTDRCLSANSVSTFADRGCCVVSTTDPYGRILGFLDWYTNIQLIKI
jgi:hypothetical protein